MIVLAVKASDSEKRFTVFQGIKLNGKGIRACQSRTLIHARSAPPTAVSQVNRNSGRMT
jgi:hypothetical protein